jgi:phosphinothricin acetyltransferase
MIRNLEPRDWEGVRRIYLEGIETGFATFETKAPSWDEWDKSHLSSMRFVMEIQGSLGGWVALSPVSSRCVYGGVGEVSLYIGKEYRGQNLGLQLLQHLIQESEKEGIWTLQAGIFTANIASRKLHEKAGFRIIGYREKIGKLGDTWMDNLLLERRSKVVGL